MGKINDGGSATNLTVRDVFAMHALTGMLADERYGRSNGETFGQKISRNAYELADAMIAQRQKATQ